MRNLRKRPQSRDNRMFETLEGRRLLSGNVDVVYDADSNTVEVSGDGRDNGILISGNITVGYTITGQAGTTVNGAATPFTVVPTGGQRANFDVSLGGGDDAVEFNNFAALAVEVAGGGGGDDIKFFNVTAFNGIHITGGGGDDNISLDFVDIHENLKIVGGGGDDDVVFGNTATGVTLFDGNADINGAGGHDTLTSRANLHANAPDAKIKIKNFS